MLFQEGNVLAEEIQHLVDRAVVTGDLFVHPALAKGELGINQHPPVQGAVVEANCAGGPRRALEDVGFSVGVDQRQLADLDNVSQNPGQQHP